MGGGGGRSCDDGVPFSRKIKHNPYLKQSSHPLLKQSAHPLLKQSSQGSSCLVLKELHVAVDTDGDVYLGGGGGEVGSTSYTSCCSVCVDS